MADKVSGRFQVEPLGAQVGKPIPFNFQLLVPVELSADERQNLAQTRDVQAVARYYPVAWAAYLLNQNDEASGELPAQERVSADDLLWSRAVIAAPFEGVGCECAVTWKGNAADGESVYFLLPDILLARSGELVFDPSTNARTDICRERLSALREAFSGYVVPERGEPLWRIAARAEHRHQYAKTAFDARHLVQKLAMVEAEAMRIAWGD